MTEQDNPEAHDFEEAAQEVQVSRVLEALDRQGEIVQLAALLQQEDVRDLLWRLLSHCHLYGSVYNKSFGDMALAEGKRQVGLWLLSEICEADPSAEMKMRQKAISLAHQQAQQRVARRRRRPEP
jgi:hypothetical protein